MDRRRVVLLALVAVGLLTSFAFARALLSSPAAEALPSAGEDVLNVSAEVHATSRLGEETMMLSGTASIERGDPHMDGGAEVVDLTIAALNLEGQSLTGPVSVAQSETFVSTGEIRSLQPPDQFPASSFLDVFIDVDVPASPSRTNPLRLHNEVAFHLVPMADGAEVPLGTWPPIGVTYRAEPDPCVLLLTAQGTPQPAEICVTSLSVTVLDAAPENPTYSVAAGGPSGYHPADLVALAPIVPDTPTPTITMTPGPETPTPTVGPTATATPGGVSSNDNFADAWGIPSLPFIGEQNTDGMTTEPGEPINPEDPGAPPGALCILAQPGEIGATVWYRFTATEADTVTASTADSLFDTVLAVYTGNAVDALTLVGCNDDTLGLQSQVTFAATPEITYYLQVGGYRNLNFEFPPATGDLTLEVTAAGLGGAAGFNPFVRIPCANLGLTADGCDDGTDGTQDDVDALSYGADLTPGTSPYAFSVAPGSLGLPGSAVAGQAACSPAQPQADEFSSMLDGSNALVFDGDGLNADCPTAASLGLVEQPESDDLNALSPQTPSFVDTNDDGVPEEPVYFSLAAGSPSLEALSLDPAAILSSVGGAAPVVYASASDLGLQPGDDIDALCLTDEGIAGTYEDGVDTVYFSLAAGSPALAALGASPADVLGPGPAVLVQAAELGLQDGDDLNALKCFSEPLPTPTPTVTSTPTATATPTATPTPTPLPPNGDVNKDGTTNSIDVTLVLQFVAGLLPSSNPNADVNQDGQINSIDATLTLQFVAGLIPGLPV